MMGIYLNANSSTSSTLSEITFGYFDDKMVKEMDLVWARSVDLNLWSVDVTNITLNGLIYTPIVTGLLSGRPYIGVPLYNGMYYNLEKAILNSNVCSMNLNEYGAFECTSDTVYTALPSINMTINGVLNISIPPSSYIYSRIINGKNYYYVAIVPVKGNDMVLGTPVLSRFYIVLDFDTKDIGLVR